MRKHTVRKLTLLLCAAALPFLSGCAAEKIVYQPLPDDALVQFIEGGQNQIACGRDRTVELNSSGGFESRTLPVPTGRRITLLTHLVEERNNIRTTCVARISFVPKAGQRYVVSAVEPYGACRLELVRVDLSSPTGLVPEPSVGRATC